MADSDATFNSTSDNVDSFLKERARAQFHELCQTFNPVIEAHWSQIETAMAKYRQDKSAFFDKVRTTIGPPTAARLASMEELKRIVPTAYEQILKLNDNLPEHLPRSSTNANAQGSFEIPVPQPLDNAILDNGEHLAPLEPGASNRHHGLVDARLASERRTGTSTTTSSLDSRKRPHPSGLDASVRQERTEGRDAFGRDLPEHIERMQEILDREEVHGIDYLFPYPKFGPGFYVIRCDRLGADGNDDDRVHHFSKHPIQRARALKHFKGKYFTCHNEDPMSDNDAILKKYGYRVMGVDADWAERSNNKIDLTTKKTGTYKAPRGPPKKKFRASAPDLASRDQPAPIADMGLDIPVSGPSLDLGPAPSSHDDGSIFNATF